MTREASSSSSLFRALGLPSQKTQIGIISTSHSDLRYKTSWIREGSLGTLSANRALKPKCLLTTIKAAGLRGSKRLLLEHMRFARLARKASARQADRVDMARMVFLGTTLRSLRRMFPVAAYNSLHPPPTSALTPPQAIPHSIQLDNYVNISKPADFGAFFRAVRF